MGSIGGSSAGDHHGAIAGAAGTASSAANATVGGVVEGLTGVFRKPLQGARSGGVKGFAKGLGRGLLGAVAKPLVGATEGVSQVLQGVHRGTAEGTAAAKRVHERIRERRAAYSTRRVLRPYSAEDARAARYAAAAGLGGDGLEEQMVVGSSLGLLVLTTERLAHFAPRGELLLAVRWAAVETLRVEGDGSEAARGGGAEARPPLRAGRGPAPGDRCAGVLVVWVDVDVAGQDQERYALVPCNSVQTACVAHGKMHKCWTNAAHK